jgi:hypothetical protein
MNTAVATGLSKVEVQMTNRVFTPSRGAGPLD